MSCCIIGNLEGYELGIRERLFSPVLYVKRDFHFICDERSVKRIYDDDEYEPFTLEAELHIKIGKDSIKKDTMWTGSIIEPTGEYKVHSFGNTLPQLIANMESDWRLGYGITFPSHEKITGLLREKFEGYCIADYAFE